MQIKKMETRENLSGQWRLAPGPAIVMAIALMAISFLQAYAPKEWEIIRLVALGVGMFFCGMPASRYASIWGRASSAPGQQQGDQQ